ncbi:hypothetical protein [Chroococcidiopsis sp.]|uniref:hypothetical protein n=1 Tax=Chroococcidiopsis sp. TaxID=3088168 RepID=UPI003F2BDC64
MHNLEQKLLADIARQLFILQIILGQISVAFIGLTIFLIEPSSVNFAKGIIVGGIVVSAIAIAVTRSIRR